RKNVVGSPFLYRSTKEFLVHFGLNDIRDLPRLEEFGDLIGENINDDLVAAIQSAEANAPTADESGDVIVHDGERDDSDEGHVAGAEEEPVEEVESSSNESQLESSGSESIEE